MAVKALISVVATSPFTMFKSGARFVKEIKLNFFEVARVDGCLFTAFYRFSHLYGCKKAIPVGTELTWLERNSKAIISDFLRM